MYTNIYTIYWKNTTDTHTIYSFTSSNPYKRHVHHKWMDG